MENQNAPMAGLFDALSKAQAEFPKIVKNKYYKLQGTKINYADLESILSTVRPILNQHGLSLTQTLQGETTNLGVAVETVIHYKDGASLHCGFITIPASKGVNVAQSLGSAITYARRYSLCAALGIATDDDDDGVGFVPQQPVRRSNDYITIGNKQYAKQAYEDFLETARAQANSGAYETWFMAERDKKNPFLSILRQSTEHEQLKALSVKAQRGE